MRPKETNRVYLPETAAAIAAAFDRAPRPPQNKDAEELRRKVAQAISRQVDEGEVDSQRLSELVLGEFLGRDSA